MALSPNEIADCQSGLLDFTRRMFRARKGSDMRLNWHQEAICDALERVVIGKTKRLIINIPPRSGKTELAVINFIAWASGIFPDSEWIHASYSKRLATNNAYGVREVMRHEVYKEIFPLVDIRIDSAAKDEFRTTAGGVVYATGAEGSITGRGAGGMSGRFQGCFPYGEMVDTEVGPMAIGDIVSYGKPIRVWSYNEKTRTPELRRVKSTFVNPANHIIEIASSDGRAIRCTPDHEVLTKAGWVSAIHLAKALHLVNAQAGESAGILSCEASIGCDAYNFIRMFWFCVPTGIGQMLRDACPCLSELDLSNDTNSDVEHFGEFGGAEAALEYLNSVFSGELGPRSSFEQRKCSVTNGILHVVALCAIRKISDRVVGGISIEMPDLIPLGSISYEVLCNEVRNVFCNDIAANGKANSVVSLAVSRRLKRSNGLCPPNLPEARYLVETKSSGYWLPDRVSYVGFHSATYCLEVEGNHNFILSQSGAVVSNCIIVDDPHKPGEALSDTMRQNVIDWFQTTMESRKNSPDTPIIVIMQRLHQNDLSGWLLEGGNGEKWQHICIPAVNEDGSSFWSDQFPIEMLNRLESSNPYVYAGQYNQLPAPAGGGIFKNDWWQYYSVEPEFEYRSIYADTAQKTGERNDYSVFQCWGYKDGRAYLIDQLRGKWEAPELLINARSFWNKHISLENGRLRAFNVEDKSSGTGLIQSLKRGDASNGISSVPVHGIQRDKDKIVRAMDVAPTIASGLVYLPSNVHWLSDFLSEASVFPNGVHDDQLDPMMDAVDGINSKRRSIF